MGHSLLSLLSEVCGPSFPISSGEYLMALARPHRLLDAAELERWAEKYAPHQFTAYEYSDACEYLDFWEWLDLTHPDVLGDFESWYREKR